MSDIPNFKYLLDRLEVVRTQSDLDSIKEEIKNCLPLDKYEYDYEKDYNVHQAVNEVKRDYVVRALDNSKNFREAAELLGLRNYQTLLNWMNKLEIKRGNFTAWTR